MNYRYHHEILGVLHDFYYNEPNKIFQENGGYKLENKPAGLSSNEICDQLKTKIRKKSSLCRLFWLKRVIVERVEPALVDLRCDESISSCYTNGEVLYQIRDKGRHEYEREFYKAKFSDVTRNNWTTLISATTALLAVAISVFSLLESDEKVPVEKQLIELNEIKTDQIKNLNDSIMYYKKQVISLTRIIEKKAPHN